MCLTKSQDKYFRKENLSFLLRTINKIMMPQSPSND